MTPSLAVELEVEAFFDGMPLVDLFGVIRPRSSSIVLVTLAFGFKFTET
jgi:hypothetical protein